MLAAERSAFGVGVGSSDLRFEGNDPLGSWSRSGDCSQGILLEAQ